MSYKDRDYHSRMADTTFWEWSEKKFEEHTSWDWTPAGAGLDDSPIDHYRYPVTLRHEPDYKAADGQSDPFYVEVQGTGKDQTYKFKLQKLEQLKFWNKIMPVWFWLWDETNDTFYIISYNRLMLLIAQGTAERGSFDNGKRPYWAFRVNLIAEQQDWQGNR